MAKTYELAFMLAGKVGSSFKNSFNTVDDKLRATNQRVISLKSNSKYLERAFNSGKIGAMEYARAYDNIKQSIKNAEKAQTRYSKAIALQNKIDNDRRKARSGMINALEMTAVLAAPISAAMKFESSMADVKKVIDFDTPEQFSYMEKAFLKLSKIIPLTANELANIGAEAGQAGIARDEVVGLTESAAMMGTAFDITASKAGGMMATWRVAFKMTQSEVDTLADQVNYLGNTSNKNATFISDVVTQIGPLGELGGIAASEVAALGASLTTVENSSKGATGLKNFILALNKGSSVTVRQSDALQKLGFNATELAKNMQEDAQGSIIAVLESIQKLEKHEQNAVMSDLFGKESIQAVSGLVGGLDVLEENFKKVNDATAYAGSMQKEFETRTATSENRLTLFKNKATAAGIAAGNVLLPGFSSVVGAAGAMFSGVEILTNKFPVLSKIIIGGTGAVLALSVAWHTLRYAKAIVLTPFAKMKAFLVAEDKVLKLATLRTKAYTAAKWLQGKAIAFGQGVMNVGRLAIYHAKTLAIAVATKAWTAAQWLWNTAMSANPIGLIVIGIAALVAAGVWAYKKFEKVRNFFDNLWKGPSEKLQKFIDKFKWLGKAWNKVKVFFGKGSGGTPKYPTNVPSYNMPGHAAGGIFNKPHLAWFAEEGAEAAIPINNSKNAKSIWSKTGQLLGMDTGGSQGIVVNYNVSISVPEGTDVSKVKDAVNEANDGLEQKLKAITNQKRRVSYA